MTDENMVMECGYCGRPTTLEVQGEYNYDLSIAELGFVSDTIWRLLKCTVCSHPTLEQIRWMYNNDDITDENDPLLTGESTILYPITTRLTKLPVSIEREYRAALKARKADPKACTMYIGRTLEAICKHQKAAGKTLSEKIDNLASSDIIPKQLARMAHQSRQIRNLGVHLNEDHVTERDVIAILEFLEVILEYLYVVPAKIEALEARLKKTP